MKKYDSYKPSGVEWIGDIPDGWKVMRIKYLCTDIFPGATPSTNVSAFWDGDIPWIPSGCCHDCDIEEAPKYITKAGLTNSSTKMIPAGTTLIALTGATCAQLGYLTINACANQSVVAFIEKKEKVRSRFIFYQLYAARQVILTNQSGGAQGGINQNDCKNITVLDCPLPEQNAIVDYLDAKCVKIDNVVAIQQKRIELLKELKQSIITKAVTKGLDKTAKMKDSGIDWIGEVPDGWEVKRVKRCCHVIRGGSPRPIDEYLTDGDGYNWIKIGDAEKGNKYITHTEEKIRKDGLQFTRLVNSGDLILSNSMSFGQPYILKVDGCIHDGWLSLSKIKGIEKEYLYYLLQSDSSKVQFEMTVDGGVVKNLNIDKVGYAFILQPTPNEQTAIVNYLDKKCAVIDRQIAQVEKQIKLLNEYKQSVITECVTGKRKVC